MWIICGQEDELVIPAALRASSLLFTVVPHRCPWHTVGTQQTFVAETVSLKVKSHSGASLPGINPAHTHQKVAIFAYHFRVVG